MKLQGAAWRFEGVLDVDWEICPIGVLREMRDKGIEITNESLGKYCMTTIDPEFPRRVMRGDFIVGDAGFGYGHDHDHASRAILGAGVAAVICESAAPYFLRNSFNHGLTVIEVSGVMTGIATGDVCEIDLHQGRLRNLTTGWAIAFPPVPSFLAEIVQAGGVYRVLEQEIRNGLHTAPRSPA